MRFVLDSNLIVSGLIWRGIPGRILNAARVGIIELYTCDELLQELARVLNYPRFAHKIQQLTGNPNKLHASYAALTQTVLLPSQLARVCRDHDDDIVLACALAAQAHAIVTGDKDLLSLRQYQQIPILNAADAWTLLARLTP